MGYYAHINSLGELTGIDASIKITDEYGSDDVKNIEVSEEVYNNKEQYIYKRGKIVINPNYDAEQLQKAKSEKLSEALIKAKDYEQNGSVEYKNCVFEMTDSNRKNLSDTQEALEKSGQTSTTWNDKNDEFVELTTEDIQYIRLNLILGRIQKLWIIDYPAYKTEIESAKTIAEVEAISIDYGVL